MTKRSLLLRLVDIRDAIDGIRDAVEGISFEAYCNTWVLHRAVERGVEIISEASRHIPDDLKAKHGEVSWHEIAAIGNVLRHEYPRVSNKIIWASIHDDLPVLYRAVDTMMTNLGTREGMGQ